MSITRQCSSSSIDVSLLSNGLPLRARSPERLAVSRRSSLYHRGMEPLAARKARAYTEEAFGARPRKQYCERKGDMRAEPLLHRDMEAEAALKVPILSEETFGERPRTQYGTLKGRTIAETGSSWHAQLRQLSSAQILLMICLVATSTNLLARGSTLFPVHRAHHFLTPLFWGPMVHAAGLLLLAAFCLRARQKSSVMEATGSRSGLSVMLYEAGCVLMGAGGASMIILSLICSKSWPDFAIGALLLLFFLIDALALGSMAHSRFVHISIAVNIYGVLFIAEALFLFQVVLRGHMMPAGYLAEVAGIFLLHLDGIVIIGTAKTLLTWTAAQC